MKRRKVPITGSRPEVNKGRPFVPNAKDTSADAQRSIASAPTPFKNDMTTAQMPAGNKAAPTAGARGSSPGKGAVGQNRPINNSGQVFGPQGTSHPSRKGAFFAGSFATKTGARDAGGNPRMQGAGSVRTTDPMAGQHGRSTGGQVNTSAAATQKPNRKGGSAFYGEY